MAEVVPPSFVVEFLGVLFNLLEMTVSVTPERMAQLQTELDEWLQRKWFVRRDLEQLIGKLQFVTNCVRPGRALVGRLRNQLLVMQPDKQQVGLEILKDVWWWKKFLPVFNSNSIMWMKQFPAPDRLIASDACLTRMGAIFENQYIHKQFPEQVVHSQEWKIHHLEMMVLIVALKTWKQRLQGKRFTVLCDNQACVEVINRGATRDGKLLDLLRELTWVCATGEFELVAQYITSEANRLPDLLSRWHLHPKYPTI